MKRSTVLLPAAWAAGPAAATGSSAPEEGAGELTVTLISTKAISDLAEKPAVGAGN